MKVLIQGYGFPVHGGALWASKTCDRVYSLNVTSRLQF